MTLGTVCDKIRQKHTFHRSFFNCRCKCGSFHFYSILRLVPQKSVIARFSNKNCSHFLNCWHYYCFTDKIKKTFSKITSYLLYFLTYCMCSCILLYSGLKYKFFVNFNTISPFGLLKFVYIHKNIQSESRFWDHGTSKRVFSLATQTKIFFNHYTFSLHSISIDWSTVKVIKLDEMTLVEPSWECDRVVWASFWVKDTSHNVLRVSHWTVYLQQRNLPLYNNVSVSGTLQQLECGSTIIRDLDQNNVLRCDFKLIHNICNLLCFIIIY